VGHERQDAQQRQSSIVLLRIVGKFAMWMCPSEPRSNRTTACTRRKPSHKRNYMSAAGVYMSVARKMVRRGGSDCSPSGSPSKQNCRLGASCPAAGGGPAAPPRTSRQDPRRRRGAGSTGSGQALLPWHSAAASVDGAQRAASDPWRARGP